MSNEAKLIAGQLGITCDVYEHASLTPPAGNDLPGDFLPGDFLFVPREGSVAEFDD